MTGAVGFLGPAGTFAEEALESVVGEVPARTLPYPTIPACFRAVADGEVAGAVVPIENSVEGSVNATLDQLAFGGGRIVIRAEAVHPIRQDLIVRDGRAVAEIARVLSHPQATAQCQGYLLRELAGAEVMAVNSTADAVRLVSESDQPWAAIGTQRAARLYGCRILATGIQDVANNSTRFVLIGREPAPATGPGRFRTSIVCAITRDRPGALLAILQEFALRAVNLTRLESRPSRTGLGSYIFFIDMEGSRDRDLPVSAAIRAIEHQDVARVTYLGSFLAHDVPVPAAPRSS